MSAWLKKIRNGMWHIISVKDTTKLSSLHIWWMSLKRSSLNQYLLFFVLPKYVVWKETIFSEGKLLSIIGKKKSLKKKKKEAALVSQLKMSFRFQVDSVLTKLSSSVSNSWMSKHSGMNKTWPKELKTPEKRFHRRASSVTKEGTASRRMSTEAPCLSTPALGWANSNHSFLEPPL